MDDPSCVGEARRFVAQLASELEFDETRKGRLSIVVNELGNNLVRYAKQAKLIVRPIRLDQRSGIDILSVDKGPGLDIDNVMTDGFTSGSTPGTGLGAVRRLSDEFDIYGNPAGTVVFSRIFSRESSDRTIVPFDFGLINVPIYGETVSGDSCSIKWAESGLEILMVDGLGHGIYAHQAAIDAVTTFDGLPPTAPDQMLHFVHNKLKSTRGGAVFLVRLKPDNKIDFAGAGNIRAITLSALKTSTMLSQNGTAGVQLRTMRMVTLPWDGVGYLVMHSDGITGSWDLKGFPGLVRCHPAVVAAVIHRDFSRGSDDSTVLLVRRHL